MPDSILLEVWIYFDFEGTLGQFYTDRLVCMFVSCCRILSKCQAVLMSLRLDFRYSIASLSLNTKRHLIVRRKVNEITRDPEWIAVTQIAAFSGCRQQHVYSRSRTSFIETHEAYMKHAELASEQLVIRSCLWKFSRKSLIVSALMKSLSTRTSTFVYSLCSLFTIRRFCKRLPSCITNKCLFFSTVALNVSWELCEGEYTSRGRSESDKKNIPHRTA